MTAAIAQLWQDHHEDDFPTEIYGMEVEGYDVGMIDADIAGCVDTFLTTGGRLDLRRTAILGLVLPHAVLAARTLPEPARAYYTRLERLGRLVLEAVCDGAPAS